MGGCLFLGFRFLDSLLLGRAGLGIFFSFPYLIHAPLVNFAAQTETASPLFFGGFSQ
jgi:hypothetical protein